jgi:hypothetical protein
MEFIFHGALVVRAASGWVRVRGGQRDGLAALADPPPPRPTHPPRAFPPRTPSRPHAPTHPHMSCRKCGCPHPHPLPPPQVLSLFMAITGSFTAIQFIETLITRDVMAGQHTSKKGSALFSVFAASWCIGVNCIWIMHFLAMSAGKARAPQHHHHLSRLLASGAARLASVSGTHGPRDEPLSSMPDAPSSAVASALLLRRRAPPPLRARLGCSAADVTKAWIALEAVAPLPPPSPPHPSPLSSDLWRPPHVLQPARYHGVPAGHFRALHAGPHDHDVPQELRGVQGKPSWGRGPGVALSMCV